jgi:hypothetical protein
VGRLRLLEWWDSLSSSILLSNFLLLLTHSLSLLHLECCLFVLALKVTVRAQIQDLSQPFLAQLFGSSLCVGPYIIEFSKEEKKKSVVCVL